MQWMLMEIIKLIVFGESMLQISFPVCYALRLPFPLLFLVLLMFSLEVHKDPVRI